MKYQHHFLNSKYSSSKNTTLYVTSPFTAFNKVVS